MGRPDWTLVPMTLFVCYFFPPIPSVVSKGCFLAKNSFVFASSPPLLSPSPWKPFEGEWTRVHSLSLLWNDIPAIPEMSWLLVGDNRDHAIAIQGTHTHTHTSYFKICGIIEVYKMHRWKQIPYAQLRKSEFTLLIVKCSSISNGTGQFVLIESHWCHLSCPHIPLDYELLEARTHVLFISVIYLEHLAQGLVYSKHFINTYKNKSTGRIQKDEQQKMGCRTTFKSGPSISSWAQSRQKQLHTRTNGNKRA